MTHSEIFKAAHQIARETKAIAGSYRIAFSCALRKVYAVTEKWMQRRDSRAVELCETLASSLRI